jgi:hypothetical protein
VLSKQSAWEKSAVWTRLPLQWRELACKGVEKFGMSVAFFGLDSALKSERLVEEGGFGRSFSTSRGSKSSGATRIG